MTAVSTDANLQRHYSECVYYQVRKSQKTTIGAPNIFVKPNDQKGARSLWHGEKTKDEIQLINYPKTSAISIVVWQIFRKFVADYVI